MGGFFGNNQLNRQFGPTLKRSASGPVNAFLDQSAFSPVHKFIASGIGNYNGSGIAPIVRHASTINGLATADNIDLTGLGFSGQAGGCFFLGGIYVVGDFFNHVATSVDGDSWTAGTVTGTAAPFVSTINGGCFDDLNNNVIFATLGLVSGNQVLTATPGPGVVHFTTSGPAVAAPVESVACRTGSGVVLALVAPGDVWKSTNGGLTWALVASGLFPGPIHNVYCIVWTGAQWIALGGNNTNVLECISTNDGGTWTPAASTGQPDSFVEIGSDGAGNLLAMLNQNSPNVYWTSNDDGSTWTNPGLFTDYGDNGCRGVIWDGSQWSVSFENADFSAEFFATSPDGQDFTPGPNILNAA